ncbi:hypothetical protein Vretimale_18154 [Volvox reticuliferus]|uniref:Uncharacterized protein n=1 Tax=Volvox reticuliferus TaxID=1737510 RepID=A0A8J4FWX0_9CHLO|nr:hypothetical protein Vretifemale_17791 [Volvox reticuliferus]GIM15242.1 hypothetical protein Vretimale_18154 [Volvox reticuliferus]
MPSLNNGRKLATKRQPPAYTDSDDDAPEEFTQTQARDQALLKRKEERHQRTEQQRVQRELRRDRHQSKAAAAAAAKAQARGRDDHRNEDKGEGEDSKAFPKLQLRPVSCGEGIFESESCEVRRTARQTQSKASEGGGEGKEEEREGDEQGEGDDCVGLAGAATVDDHAGDFLPESVLAAVAARDEEAHQAAATAAAERILSKRAQRRAAKRQRLQAVKESVVTVAVLPKIKVPAGGGGNFLKNSLYGSRIQRSVDMLTKPGNRPSAKFV